MSSRGLVLQTEIQMLQMNILKFAVQPGSEVAYPIITDPNREIIKELNMLEPEEKDPSGNQVPSRALHMVGPDKKVRTH